MKRIFILTPILFIVNIISAQTFSLKGTILEKQEQVTQPVEYVSVSLLKPDSSFIAGVVTDAKGNFLLKNIAPSDYLISISYIGYAPTQLEVKNLNSDKDLGSIEIKELPQQLDEVKVTAQSVIQKSDRKIIIPSQAQIGMSTNAADLVRKLGLPRINVDPLSNAITTFMQGGVQLRINGVEVTSNDVSALKADDIIRIEYHDEPGLRYGNVALVIDFITRRHDSGGNIFAMVMQGLDPDKGFMEDRLNAKINHKKSEFGLTANWGARDIKWTRENDETYIFPDRPTLHRTEIGEPTKFKYGNMEMVANYNLMDDKYYLNATFRGNFMNTPNSYSDRRSTVFSNGNDPVSISDLSTEKSNSPSLDVYYQRNLKNDQTLVFNVVGTYIDTENSRTYLENKNDELITDIISNIKGNKYSLIGEAIYEKKLNTGKFTGGLKHTQSYTDNEYSGSSAAVVNMNNAETYGYAEYMIKVKKMTYTLGVGAQRNYYKQANQSTDKTFFRPSVRITYNINDNSYIRLNSYLSSYAPSLASLNNVSQDIDSLQIRVGNPNLKPVQYYSNTITAGYKKGIFGIDLYMMYRYDHKPEMDKIYYDDEINRFVHTTTNQKGQHNFRADVSTSLKPWGDYVAFYFTPGITRYVTQGDDYTHTYTGKYCRASLWFNYKGVTLGGEFRTYDKYLSSETIISGEKSHMLYLGYNNQKKNYSVNLIAFNPFTKRYKQTQEVWSAIAPSTSKIFTDSLSPMFMLNMTYNFSFGRQYKKGEKRTDNKDSDSGIISGSKK